MFYSPYVLTPIFGTRFRIRFLGLKLVPNLCQRLDSLIAYARIIVTFAALQQRHFRILSFCSAACNLENGHKLAVIVLNLLKPAPARGDGRVCWPVQLFRTVASIGGRGRLGCPCQNSINQTRNLPTISEIFHKFELTKFLLPLRNRRVPLRKQGCR